MGQVLEVEPMSVSNDAELWDYLAGQPIEVTRLLAYRAALRALADVSRFEKLDEDTGSYVLAACRATLTAGVMIYQGGDRLGDAATQAAKASGSVRAMHKKLSEEDALAADGMVRVISAIEAAVSQDASEVVDLAGHAMAHDYDCYEDCDLELAQLATSAIAVDPVPMGLRSQFAASDAWAFWRAWHEEALKGTPLPWALQAEIARLPQAAWEAGPAVISARITRIFARLDLKERIEQLERRMKAQDGSDEFDGEGDQEAADTQAAAGFAAMRLIHDPVQDLLKQMQSPKPQPFLIQKSTERLTLVLAASGKWLGRAAEGDIKDMVRMIGKGGGVATATWIDTHSAQIRAVITAAENWRHRLPS